MYTLQEQKKCSVNITSNKNRIKQYESSVYLKDGQQFELEIFNPHQFKVLAKISINGKEISQKEYDETVTKKMEEFRQMNQGRGGNGTMQIRMGR